MNTHSVLMAIFPGEPGLAGCPLNYIHVEKMNNIVEYNNIKVSLIIDDI